ncbi:Uncharacterized protein (Fragment), partial [Durusdinium trenchii]
MPVAERNARLQEQQNRLKGIHFSPETEPSHKLVDLVCQMSTDQTLEWIPWEKLTSRASEVTHTQKDLKLAFDATGSLKVAHKDQTPDAAVTGELKVRQALNRRSRAFDLAKLCSFTRMEEWHERVFEVLQKEPAANAMPVTLQQVREADKTLFKKLSEKTRGRLTQAPDGTKPMDTFLDACMDSAEVQFCNTCGTALRHRQPWQRKRIEANDIHKDDPELSKILWETTMSEVEAGFLQVVLKDGAVLSGPLHRDFKESMKWKGLLKALGWKFSEDPKKALPFAEEVDVLGVRLSVGNLHQGAFAVENKPGRIEKISALIQEVATEGRISKRQAQVIHGNLNFAMSFVLGHTMKVAARAFACLTIDRSSPDTNQLVPLCEWTLDLLKVLKPRVTESSGSVRPVLIFTDAAYEGGLALAIIAGKPYTEEIPLTEVRQLCADFSGLPAILS